MNKELLNKSITAIENYVIAGNVPLPDVFMNAESIAKAVIRVIVLECAAICSKEGRRLDSEFASTGVTLETMDHGSRSFQAKTDSYKILALLTEES